MENTTMSGLPLLIFDVNETLLDLEVLVPHFERIFGSSAVLREWFAQLILYAEAITLTEQYVSFGELGGAVLQMIGKTRGIHITDAEIETIKDAVANMPAHPEVPAALDRLRRAGFRLFTLTNNPKKTCERQLQNAGIDAFFERQFSVDDGVRRYKPAREVYRAVEEHLGVPADRLCLIACHTWDTLGASAAGWKTVLVLRTGNAELAVGGQPLIISENLHDAAEKLLHRYLQNVV
jgi:2-haloacid dehalogenase